MKKILALLALMLSLQGCVAAFIAGAAAGGIMVYDRRTIAVMANDQSNSFKISTRINSTAKQYPNSHIIVASFDRVILLVGETPSQEFRSQAAEIARSTGDVRRVFNYIQIEGASSVMTRASDSLVTTKTRTAMLATRDLHSTQIKIVTENGITFLMGNLTRHQADLATRVARRIGGVQKVVTLFEYTD